MPRINGTFYFKLTTAGQLLGEYSNADTPRARPECAFRDEESKGAARTTFAGTYTSVWYEPTNGGVAVTTKLTIEPKSEPADPMTQFTLTWTEVASGTDMFQGEAMLNDGLLIGHYHSVA